jgi:fission process protein 1
MADKKGQDDPNHLNDIPHQRKESRPDFTEPPPPTKLPKSLQDTLDNEEKWWETFVGGRSGESTESNVRYAGYAARLRTILLAAHRYVAYTSDIGESFRPVTHPNLVRGAYAIPWLYIGGDVGYEGYKAYLRQQRALHPEAQKGAPSSAKSSGADVASTPAAQSAALVPRTIPAIEDYRAVMAQRAVFQSIASMGLPAFTIHSIVRYSGRAMKNVKNVTIRTWGPIGVSTANSS